MESGKSIRPLRLRCNVIGSLNEDKTNAVLVYHALSGSSRLHEWWDNVIGSGLALDTSKHAFVCVNYPGSCYGSVSAKEIKNRTGAIPLITTSDVVRANQILAEYLGIRVFKMIVGASIGGMIALRHAVDFPDSVKRVIAVAAAPLSPLGIAMNHLQRQAVSNGDLGLARKIAILTYKSSALLEQRFARRPNRNGEDPFTQFDGRFDVEGYLDAKASEFVDRFESESYLTITKMMDLFELNDEEARKITARVDLVGISSDWLFPPTSIRSFEQSLRQAGVDCQYYEIESDGGHDAFLAEPDQVNEVITGINRNAELKTAA